MADEREFLGAFGQAVIDRRWEDGAAMLAPWLNAELGADGLRQVFKIGRIEDTPPPFSVLEAGLNPLGIADLRDLSPLFDDRPVAFQPIFS